jgi:transcriptional repressor NrdR
MRCPVCSHTETHVVDSRLAQDETSIRRRRECDQCQFRFSTLEEIELLGLTVVKRDGRRESYSREKMERGLRRALEKRSHTEVAFRSLVQQIELAIQRERSTELTSARLGELVMQSLKSFDKVAYIRFASVYRSFEDVKTFQEELEQLTSKQKQRSTRRSPPAPPSATLLS